MPASPVKQKLQFFAIWKKSQSPVAMARLTRRIKQIVESCPGITITAEVDVRPAQRLKFRRWEHRVEIMVTNGSDGDAFARVTHDIYQQFADMKAWRCGSDTSQHHEH